MEDFDNKPTETGGESSAAPQDTEPCTDVVEPCTEIAEPCTESAELCNANTAAEPADYDSAKTKLKPVWKGIALASVLIICAFAGAFFGVFYICRTSIYKESKFFDAFIAKWSGVTENRVEVEYISGEYKGDAIELADKALSHTVIVRAGQLKDEGNTFVQSNSGSGVIYARVDNSSTYYIVTNYHVVSGASHIITDVYDESETDEKNNRYNAQLLYTDELSDIAVLKISSSKELAVAKQADSSNAQHGQSIIIAGNPLGNGFAVSLGYISNPYRVTSANNYIPLMTLDAAVNFGNSGGGVYDTAGNLIGLVVSKASGEDVDGIGYAIPVNTVNSVVNDLLTTPGYVKGRPALGITVIGISNTLSYSAVAENDLNGYIYPTENPKHGVYIIESKNAPLKKGDLIVSIDGTLITASADISAVLLGKKPGETVSVTVERQSLDPESGEIIYTPKTESVTLIERDFPD